MNRHSIFRVNGSAKRDPAINRWFAEEEKALRAIGKEWFTRMRQCGQDVRELIHDGCPVACIEDAPFAYVNIYSRHVGVGFFYGSTLDDPEGLLEGSGKWMRHVKLRPESDVNTAALRALIDAAYADIKARLAAERLRSKTDRKGA